LAGGEEQSEETLQFKDASYNLYQGGSTLILLFERIQINVVNT